MRNFNFLSDNFFIRTFSFQLFKNCLLNITTTLLIIFDSVPIPVRTVKISIKVRFKFTNRSLSFSSEMTV